MRSVLCSGTILPDKSRNGFPLLTMSEWGWHTTPTQEGYQPEDTLNPLFETEYWRFGLKLAAVWAERLKKHCPEKWRDVEQHLA